MGSLKNTMKFFILKFVIIQCTLFNASKRYALGYLVDKNNIEKRLKRTHDYPNTSKPRHKITQEAVLIGGILWRMTLLLILRLTL
ncbi:hypothetical protein VN0773_08950 [Helicobacter pylori]